MLLLLHSALLSPLVVGNWRDVISVKHHLLSLVFAELKLDSFLTVCSFALICFTIFAYQSEKSNTILSGSAFHLTTCSNRANQWSHWLDHFSFCHYLKPLNELHGFIDQYGCIALTRMFFFYPLCSMLAVAGPAVYTKKNWSNIHD